ncbi:MAG: glycosyltransferase family 4 protein, partial [Micrococcales bacterium]|nr:glycosyltransferase family 4 protein [Micrococcales bacterium]
MRIGFVTQWFPPEPAGIAAGIADGLASRGHVVEVVTGFPNYPSGHLAQGYRIRPYVREQRSEQVTVHRAPLVPSHDSSAARRVLTYTSFALGAASVLPRVPRPDVWLSYSSPVTATLPALLSRAFDGARGHPQVPHAQIIQDLWPDSVTASGFIADQRVSAMAERALGAYCDRCYRQSAAIGVISPSMRGVLRERGVPDHVIVDTPNWVDTAPAPDLHEGRSGRAELGMPAGRVFLYAGNLGELQALPALIDAFAGIPDAHLVLLGDGVARERIAADLRARGLPNVHLFPACAPALVGAYLAAADALIVSLADTPLLRATMPSKVQSSLATGRPILAHAAGDVAAVVTRSGAGVAATPGDLPAVRAAIER